MKKSLLALAALTAFAGAASAQSSVTAFGIVDLAGTYVDGSTSKYLLATSGMSTSRLGFRGVEDLGGGLKAGFWLEGQLDADDGNAAGFNWQRRSTVSLISNVGELRMGRDYTPVYWNWNSFDPFGATGLGSSTNLGLEVSTFNGGSYGTLVRANNTIGYFLPAMGGLYGQAMVAAGEGTPGNKIISGRLGYAAGPFDIAAAYGITEFSSSVDLTNWNIAGSFDAGFAKFFGFYSSLDADNNLFTQTNWFVGATVPFGAWSFKATYGSVTRDPTSLTTGDAKKPVAFGDADQIAVGVVYDLSKRTALYATYSDISNTGTAFRVFGGTNAPAAVANQDSKGYALGIRHSF
jgi:predicted porin